MKVTIESTQFTATLEIPAAAYKYFAELQAAIRNESGVLEATQQAVIHDLLLLLDGLGNWAGDVPEVFDGSFITLVPLTFPDAWELAEQTVSSTVALVTYKGTRNETIQPLANLAEATLKRCKAKCLDNPNDYRLETLQNEIAALQRNYAKAYNLYLEGIRDQETETN